VWDEGKWLFLTGRFKGPWVRGFVDARRSIFFSTYFESRWRIASSTLRRRYWYWYWYLKVSVSFRSSSRGSGKPDQDPQFEVGSEIQVPRTCRWLALSVLVHLLFSSKVPTRHLRKDTAEKHKKECLGVQYLGQKSIRAFREHKSLVWPLLVTFLNSEWPRMSCMLTQIRLRLTAH
jgi:hypothetical protein